MYDDDGVGDAVKSVKEVKDVERRTEEMQNDGEMAEDMSVVIRMAVVETK